MKSPSSPASATLPLRRFAARLAGLVPYISIARPDHWFKNAFMVLGVILVCFYHPEHLGLHCLAMFFLGVASVCLVASSNYVLNEILDAPTDREHPAKRNRPIPAGQVDIGMAYTEWAVLSLVGLGLAWTVSVPFFLAAAALWGMGLVYNVPPVRSKELPYIDVLTESVNNPIRLLLGWFAITAVTVPPLSLMLSYWMLGAFLMATKRFSEYRTIGDPQQAGAYRSSFRFYDENRLLVSMLFYAAASALFLGVFIIRYHLEIVLALPLIAGCFAYYLHVALKPDSAAQSPERLYKEKGLMIYLVVCLVVFFGLMFVQIPALYDLFNVAECPVSPLWEF
jgi:decaprenyl-phosphate phosphoribosyltransferase